VVSRLNPYLNFRAQAREAMEFYRSVFGGELTLTTFAEFGMPAAPGEEGLIMHGQLETPSGFTLMGADVPSTMEYSPGTNFTVSLSGDHAAYDELSGYWRKLAESASFIGEELKTAPWGDSFGMLTDRYGVPWLMNIGGPPGEGDGAAS